MEKLNQFIKKFLESEGFKLLLEKIKSAFDFIQVKVNHIPILAKILEKLTALVVQHKIAAAAISTVIVLSPSFLGSPDFPSVCRKLDYSRNYAIRYAINELIKEIEEPFRYRFYKIYSEEEVATFFKAKYHKLLKLEGKERADLFVKKMEQSCAIYLKLQEEKDW